MTAVRPFHAAAAGPAQASGEQGQSRGTAAPRSRPNSSDQCLSEQQQQCCPCRVRSSIVRSIGGRSIAASLLTLSEVRRSSSLSKVTFRRAARISWRKMSNISALVLPAYLLALTATTAPSANLYFHHLSATRPDLTTTAQPHHPTEGATGNRDHMSCAAGPLKTATPNLLVLAG